MIGQQKIIEFYSTEHYHLLEKKKKKKTQLKTNQVQALSVAVTLQK